MSYVNAAGVEYESRCVVICKKHGSVSITDAEELAQLEQPDASWYCPKCGEPAEWDDNCPASNPMK